MELTKGTKVIVRDDFGEEWKGTVENISNYREPSMKYAVDLDDICLDDYVFVGEDRIRVCEDVKGGEG